MCVCVCEPYIRKWLHIWSHTAYPSRRTSQNLSRLSSRHGLWVQLQQAHWMELHGAEASVKISKKIKRKKIRKSLAEILKTFALKTLKQFMQCF